MKSLIHFSRRPTEKLSVPSNLVENKTARGEKLKGKVMNYRRAQEWRTAYLAKAHYGDPKAVRSVMSRSMGGADEPLVEAVHSLFAKHFNHAVHLDIMFLRTKQEEEVALVCRPFYQLN